MQDLSLHILDLVQNSIAAKATVVEISIIEDGNKDWLTIKISDNGKGIENQIIDKVTDPFYTTRTTRKVGLGLPLFKAAAERCGGSFSIRSTLNVGTCIEANFILSHIDRPPFGDLAETLLAIIICNPCVDIVYSHKTNSGSFVLDTREIRAKITGIPIDHPDVIDWIRSYIVEGLMKINGGVE